MQFLTLDDEEGIFEVVLFPDVYRKVRFLLDGPGPYIVEGRVEDQYGAVTVHAWSLTPFQGDGNSSKTMDLPRQEEDDRKIL